jgi:hypothetical protein
MALRTSNERLTGRLTLPKTLAYTAFRVAIGGTLACGGGVAPTAPPADAATADAVSPVDASKPPADGSDHDAATADATEPPHDASDDACATQSYCGPAAADASCPGFVCGLDCPAGCEPYS